jgi:DNA (cytosine-5)-methyltransferase 1
MKRSPVHAADLFCGAGGTSAGLVDACKELDHELRLVAINHWEVAIQTHTKNHPFAQHLCADLDQVNPLHVVQRRQLDILVASPECTHHSIARGGRPINDQSRASAWVILKWVQELNIKNVLIENVKEFRDWGPLDTRGRPMKSRKGAIYYQFLQSLKAFGYNVDAQVLNCADYGDATTRERLFIIARRGRRPIVWPEPSHSPTGASTMFGSMKKWRSAREIIDWELKGASIYTRKRALKANTLARIYAGIEKFCGPMIAEAFLADVSSQFPTTLVKEFLVILRRNGDAKSIDEPIPTLTAGGNHVGLCQFVLQQQSGGVPRSTDKPLPALATRGAISKVDAFILPQFSEHAARSVEDPLNTLTTTSRGIGLFQLNIDHHGGNGKQVRSIEQPLSTQTTKARTAIAEAFMVQTGGPEGKGRHPRSIDAPLATVLTENRTALIKPFLIGHPRQKNGRNRTPIDSVEDPMRTVTATSSDFSLVQPSIVKYNGTAKTPNSVDEPLDTVSTRDRFGLVEPRITPDYKVEVLFRMLQPHELAGAHSISDFHWPEGTTKSDIVKMIGNGVPRRTATALCRSLLQ